MNIDGHLRHPLREGDYKTQRSREKKRENPLIKRIPYTNPSKKKKKKILKRLDSVPPILIS